MKRMLCLLMSFFMLVTASAALAAEPDPIKTIPYEELPEPAPGQHHYVLLCVDQW